MVLLNRDLESKLSTLPANTRSEYLRQAIDLMVTISPPEKFRASLGAPEPEPMAEGKPETPSEPETPSVGQ